MTTAAPTGRLSGRKATSYVRAVNVPEARASRFTAKYMLSSDIAYALSAKELGLTPADSADVIISALLDTLGSLEDRDTLTPPGDIVAQRETWIADKIGKQHGAWLHLGRNRGESLRSYLPRMFFRQALHEQGRTLTRLLRNLLDRAEPLLESVSPNYHHLHHSGFATVGEYLLSWAIVFERHIDRIKQVDSRLDMGPSAAGSRAELNELYDRVSARLGFTRRARLRRDGIWVHDQFTEPFFLISLISVDLARLAQDLRTWMTSEFSLFIPADEHAGGSSALPHAKVPFGLQAVIGTSMMASTRLAGEMTAASNPSEGSEPLYQSATLYGLAEDVIAATDYVGDMVRAAEFDLEEMERKSKLDYPGSSEALDRLVFDFGVPFRVAHRLLGSMVRAHFLKQEPFDLKVAIQSEAGRDVPVDQDEIMNIILGRIFWRTTFDFPQLRKTWQEVDQSARAANLIFTEASVVERAIESLIQEAKTVVNG